MARPPAWLTVLFGALLALATIAWDARADTPGTLQADEAMPRDVGVLLQPAAARLAPLPSDFRRMDDGWLVLELPASVSDRIEPLAREAQSFRARLSRDLGQPVLEHDVVRIARSPEQMAELAPVGAPPPPYAAGVAYPSAHLALLALKAPETWEAPDLTELLRHELTHLALFDAVAGHHVPRWYDEGLAIHESGELWMARSKTLFDASLSKRLLPLPDLDRGFPPGGYDVSVAYAESSDVVRFLMRSDDRARFGSLVERVRRGVDFNRALEDAYGTDVRKLEYQWREEVGRRYGLIPVLTGSGVFWALMSSLVVLAFLKRRRQARAKMEQWAREEAESSLLSAPTQVPDPDRPSDASPPPGPRPGVPWIEHDGRWHTLH